MQPEVPASPVSRRPRQPDARSAPSSYGSYSPPASPHAPRRYDCSHRRPDHVLNLSPQPVLHNILPCRPKLPALGLVHHVLLTPPVPIPPPLHLRSPPIPNLPPSPHTHSPRRSADNNYSKPCRIPLAATMPPIGGKREPQTGHATGRSSRGAPVAVDALHPTQTKFILVIHAHFRNVGFGLRWETSTMGGHGTVSGGNRCPTWSDTSLPGPVLGTSCAVPISCFPPVPDPVQSWRRLVRPPP